MCSTRRLSTPKEKPDITVVFLAHRAGISFEVAQDRVHLYPEKDLAFIDHDLPESTASRFALELDFEAHEDDKVVNVGFPERGSQAMDWSFAIDFNDMSVKFDCGPWRQEGAVTTSEFELVLQSIDVNLYGANCILLDHASEIGFSGGPLIRASSGKVIGLISSSIPPGL